MSTLLKSTIIIRKEEHMKRLFVIKSVWQIVEALIFIALGVIAIVYSGNKTFWNVIGYVTGALLALDGLLRLIMYFAADNVDVKKVSLIVCISEITLAVFIFICAKVVVAYFALLIAILLLVVGFVAMVDSIVKIAKKSEKLSITIPSIVISAIFIALGVVALVFFPSNPTSAKGVNTISVLLIVSGVLLILGGIAEAVYTCVMASKIKKVVKDTQASIAKEREEKRTDK